MGNCILVVDSSLKMRDEVDAIIRALGDLLLQLGCDTAWLVPNTSLNTKQLNASVAKYQALLDSIELEITSASVRAREKVSKAAHPKTGDIDSIGEGPAEPIGRDDLQAFSMDSLNDKFDNDLRNGLGDEIDIYDMSRNDGMGMFDDLGDSGMHSSSLQVDANYRMIDDQFF